VDMRTAAPLIAVGRVAEAVTSMGISVRIGKSGFYNLLMLKRFAIIKPSYCRFLK